MDSAVTSSGVQPGAELGRLLVGALIAGLATGLVVSSFRLVLEAGDHFRNAFLVEAAAWGVAGLFATIVLAAVAVAAAAWMVQSIAPDAAGSGIPRVQAVLADELPPASTKTALVKFAAGSLAMGSGLAVGREGPSVQIGAIVARLSGSLLGIGSRAVTPLIAAGAGAGFAAAFAAPVAGAIFGMEALLRRFDSLASAAILVASVAAVWAGQLILGNAVEVKTSMSIMIEPSQLPLYGLVGLVAGAGAVVYIRTILATLAIADRLAAPLLLRAALIGALVGACGWMNPQIVGSGAPLLQSAVDGNSGPLLLGGLLAVRLALVAISVAAGTPGGLLVPMLALGADLGLLVAVGLSLHADATSLALAGMAAFFAAVLRTPLTAIVLVAEMTGQAGAIVSMTVAAAAALLVPLFTGEAPLLDSLRQRQRLQS